MNSIFVIKPYKWEGMWVFDDPNVGLVKEAFVGGTDTIIDVATAALPNASEGFLAVFSAGYFPDAEIVLEWVRESGGGNVYHWAEKKMDGWLCPSLFKYFDQTPEKLYVQVKDVKESRYLSFVDDVKPSSIATVVKSIKQLFKKN